MRFHVILAVWKRTLLSYFSGVIGYLFITAFVAVGASAAFQESFFANNLANLDQLNQWFPWLLLVIVPAITMGVWADERKQGTDELLFTLPATDVEVLVGKYLGVLSVYTVALVFSLSHIIVLRSLGYPDVGLMAANYLGYWFAGAALLSCGMVASALTNSATVAYVLGILIGAVPVGIGSVNSHWPLLDALSIPTQFRDFGQGVVPLGGVLYFTSLTVFMLYVNLVLLNRRHWSGGPHAGEMWGHFVVRSLSLAGILVGLNIVASNVTSRIDFTSEGLFSLSGATRKVVREIPANRPVMIQAFVSPLSSAIPKEYVEVRANLVGLLRELDSLGGDRVRVRIIETARFTPEADEAKRYGIESQRTQTERGGRFEIDEVFLGTVMTTGADEEVVTPFFDVGTPVEYELMRSLRTVSQVKRSKVGILRTDAKVVGGFDMQSFRQTPEWRIVTELKKQYDVKEIGPDDLGKEPIDVLVAIMPSSLNEPDMQKFVAYVDGGGPTLIIDDPFPITNASLAPKQPKPRQGGMGGMFGGGPPPEPKADNGEAKALLNALEIAWDSGESVWDFYDPHPELAQMLRGISAVYVGVNSGGSRPFNPESEITSGLQEVLMLYPGQIRPRQDSKLEFTALLRTSNKATTLPWEEYTETAGFMGGVQPAAQISLKMPARPIEYVLAAKISGEKSGAPGPNGETSKRKINAIFIADIDMISDTFFTIREKNWQNLKLDNVTFVLNCVDELAGDDTFMALRKRRPRHRTLTGVEQETTKLKAEFAEVARKAMDEAKSKLKQAEESLKEETKKILSDTTMDEQTKAIRLRTAEENERRRLEVAKLEIENEKSKTLEREDDKTRRKVRTIEQSRQALACILSPIPALIVGAFVFARRVSNERQGIVDERLVERKRA